MLRAALDGSIQTAAGLQVYLHGAIALSHSCGLFPGGNHSLLSGRRHKGSQNNSAAEKHRSWSLHLGSYSSCKELKQLQKAGMLQCEMGHCSTLVRGLASLLISFLTCELIRAQKIASSPRPALEGPGSACLPLFFPRNSALNS